MVDRLKLTKIIIILITIIITIGINFLQEEEEEVVEDMIIEDTAQVICIKVN